MTLNASLGSPELLGYLNPQIIIIFFFPNFFILQAALKSPMSSRLIAPAPAMSQGHIPVPAKVSGHITVPLESSISPASIPVATISGQQVLALLTLNSS